MHDRAFETCEPSCMPRVAKPFFILVLHSPSRTVGHMTEPEFPSLGGRAQSHGTHGSTGAHLIREARSRAEVHVAVPVLTSARR
jgi:hypothetical protein